MQHRTPGEKAFDVFNAILLAAIGIAMLFPFLYIFSVSFSTLTDFLQREIILWPSTWSFDAYQYILESKPFLRSLGTTAFITVAGTFVNLFFTGTMAYALSRNIMGQRFFLFLVLFTILFSAGMIPTYLIVKETGLLNSLWALVLPVAIAPFNLIVIRQFFLNIPNELNEAATIDGANDLRIFATIILPLSKPALAAFSLFYAVGHWNAYFNAILYLNDPAKWTIQVILRQIVVIAEPTAALGTSDMLLENPPPPETIQMAAILLATVPILIVYPFLQKHFAKGVMLGSVKG
ncbi:carbohydrate ABC transporter permease [Paenibacillus antri]|nr:carbohydrate ABC transporter permease [Paenibacillus antri]